MVCDFEERMVIAFLEDSFMIVDFSRGDYGLC